MPNKNNKNKPNGFILYANEIRDDLLREGHVIRGMPDLISVASPRWNGLPADEREYYKDRAKWEWENSRNNNASQYMKKPVRPDRRDCSGALMSDRVDIVMFNEEKKKKERTEVFSSWPQGRAVTERSFYFVSFICLLEEPNPHPIEVAAVEFSLLGGILRNWHKHINPGPIEMGYQYLAQQISETTHLIPVTGIAEPRDTYTSIYDELLQFISRGTNHIPPIHVKKSDCEKVEGCIKWLARMAGRPHQLKRIYELDGLIIDLDSHLNGQPQDFFRSQQHGTELISSTIFDWDSESKCSFHQENETKFCAKGYVNKYCFLMSRFFCEVHCIPSTENHQPVHRKEKLYTLINSSSSSREKPKTKTKEEFERDMMAREVAQKLSNFAMRENALDEDDIERKALEDEQMRQEQKKRWLSLRGGESNADSMNSSIVNGSALSLNEVPKSVFGRGRGRGAASVMQSLRRPGDSGSGKVQLPFGRGTKMYTGN